MEVKDGGIKRTGRDRGKGRTEIGKEKQKEKIRQGRKVWEKKDCKMDDKFVEQERERRGKPAKRNEKETRKREAASFRGRKEEKRKGWGRKPTRRGERPKRTRK